MLDMVSVPENQENVEQNMKCAGSDVSFAVQVQGPGRENKPIIWGDVPVDDVYE